MAQKTPTAALLHGFGQAAMSSRVRALVAGSAADVPGASAVGMPVFWHNRLRLSSIDARVQPLYVADSLWPILELV